MPKESSIESEAAAPSPPQQHQKQNDKDNKKEKKNIFDGPCRHDASFCFIRASTSFTLFPFPFVRFTLTLTYVERGRMQVAPFRITYIASTPPRRKDTIDRSFSSPSILPFSYHALSLQNMPHLPSLRTETYSYIDTLEIFHMPTTGTDFLLSPYRNSFHPFSPLPSSFFKPKKETNEIDGTSDKLISRAKNVIPLLPSLPSPFLRS